MSHRTLAFGLVILGLLAGGCSGSDRADTATSPSASTPTAAPEITAAAVQKATLSIEDMDPGWSEYDLSESADEAATRIGGQIGAGTVKDGVLSRAVTAFSQGQEQALVPTGYVANTVYLMDSQESAKKVLSDLRTASTTREWQQNDPDGTTSFKLAALSFEKLGDETFAVRLNNTFKDAEFGSDDSYSVDYITYRIDRVVTFVFVRLANAGGLSRKSENKVRQLVAGALN